MDTQLALDGPLNGQYITAAQAAEYNYELCDWAPGFSEKVYMQPVVREEQDRREGDGDEFARRFPYADERTG